MAKFFPNVCDEAQPLDLSLPTKQRRSSDDESSQRHVRTKQSGDINPKPDTDEPLSQDRTPAQIEEKGATPRYSKDLEDDPGHKSGTHDHDLSHGTTDAHNAVSPSRSIATDGELSSQHEELEGVSGEDCIFDYQSPSRSERKKIQTVQCSATPSNRQSVQASKDRQTCGRQKQTDSSLLNNDICGKLKSKIEARNKSTLAGVDASDLTPVSTTSTTTTTTTTTTTHPGGVPLNVQRPVSRSNILNAVEARDDDMEDDSEQSESPARRHSPREMTATEAGKPCQSLQTWPSTDEPGLEEDTTSVRCKSRSSAHQGSHDEKTVEDPVRSKSPKTFVGSETTFSPTDPFDTGSSPNAQDGVPALPVGSPERPRSAGTSAVRRDGNMTLTLQNAELWKSFCDLGTEMIINRGGRRMFPYLMVTLTGLEPMALYTVWVEVTPADSCQYKFLHGSWKSVGDVDRGEDPWRQSAPDSQWTSPAIYVHPDSPNRGHHWLSDKVTFAKLKLTNSRDNTESFVVLRSMRKYFMSVVVMDESTRETRRFQLPETSFVAVTQYQNEAITRMKIQNNPFANGLKYADLTSHGKKKKSGSGKSVSGEGSAGRTEGRSSAGMSTRPFGHGSGGEPPVVLTSQSSRHLRAFDVSKSQRLDDVANHLHLRALQSQQARPPPCRMVDITGEGRGAYETSLTAPVLPTSNLLSAGSSHVLTLGPSAQQASPVTQPSVSSTTINDVINTAMLESAGDVRGGRSHASLEWKRNGDIELGVSALQVWRLFAAHGNEMIINKMGRRMFPYLIVRFKGLNPNALYSVWLEFCPVDQNFYRYTDSGWVPAEPVLQDLRPRRYRHPDSPNRGTFWLRDDVQFKFIKLTNNPDSGDKVTLQSKRKYYITLVLRPEAPGEGPLEREVTFPLPETTFVATTQYQNSVITDLKISWNPFATGFRNQMSPKGETVSQKETTQSTSASCGNTGSSQDVRPLASSSGKQSETGARRKRGLEESPGDPRGQDAKRPPGDSQSAFTTVSPASSPRILITPSSMLPAPREPSRPDTWTAACSAAPASFFSPRFDHTFAAAPRLLNAPPAHMQSAVRYPDVHPAFPFFRPALQTSFLQPVANTGLFLPSTQPVFPFQSLSTYFPGLPGYAPRILNPAVGGPTHEGIGTDQRPASCFPYLSQILPALPQAGSSHLGPSHSVAIQPQHSSPAKAKDAAGTCARRKSPQKEDSFRGSPKKARLEPVADTSPAENEPNPAEDIPDQSEANSRHARDENAASEVPRVPDNEPPCSPSGSHGNPIDPHREGEEDCEDVDVTSIDDEDVPMLSGLER